MAKPIVNGGGQAKCKGCNASVSSGLFYTGIKTAMGWVCSPGCKQKIMRGAGYGGTKLRHR